jgi:prepilin peptidase dependent protein B
MRRSRSSQQRSRPSAGLSIVELMIGIAIGLFIVAGATLMLTTQLGDNRRLLLEAQVQQDLRAAADMISRDIRRAGYWGQAYQQVWPAATAASNPYVRMDPAAAPLGTNAIEYDRSTDEDGAVFGTDDNAVDVALNRPRERVGFKLNATNKTIDYMVGANNWQALTDKDVLEVTTFQLDLTSRLVDVPCGAGPCGPCVAGLCPALNPITGCRLVQAHRDVTITIVAEALHDRTVRRALRDNVRLRNSVPREVC